MVRTPVDDSEIVPAGTMRWSRFSSWGLNERDCMRFLSTARKRRFHQWGEQAGREAPPAVGVSRIAAAPEPTEIDRVRNEPHRRFRRFGQYNRYRRNAKTPGLTRRLCAVVNLAVRRAGQKAQAREAGSFISRIIVIPKWQLDREGGALADNTLDADAPAVLFDYLAADAQSQPRAAVAMLVGLFGRVERLED